MSSFFSFKSLANFVDIKLGNEYVSNVGIKIDSGRKIGIEIESEGIAMRTGGKIEVGGMSITREDIKEVRELGEIFGDLRVGRGEDGRYGFMGKVDVGDILGRVVAFLMLKNNMK